MNHTDCSSPEPHVMAFSLSPLGSRVRLSAPRILPLYQLLMRFHSSHFSMPQLPNLQNKPAIMTPPCVVVKGMAAGSQNCTCFGQWKLSFPQDKHLLGPNLHRRAGDRVNLSVLLPLKSRSSQVHISLLRNTR